MAIMKGLKKAMVSVIWSSIGVAGLDVCANLPSELGGGVQPGWVAGVQKVPKEQRNGEQLATARAYHLCNPS